jgi:hypothetical protein
MQFYILIFVLFTKYLLQVSALTVPSSIVNADDGAVSAEICSRYLVNNTNIELYTYI